MTQQVYPKISVVTPNFNQGDFIERTIRSVLDQGYPNLEYVIIDGGSTDDSVAIIKKYEDKLHYWISEKDSGMYYAINKGFSHTTGEILCWINSDDVLWEGSLEYIAEVFIKHSNVKWLQGYPSVIDEKGELLYQREPVCSKYHFYRGHFKKDFSFIQQESTFWRRELWEQAGGKLSLEYSLAADFDLWLRFFAHAKMYCSKRQLAAFRKRSGQKSDDNEKYLNEANASVEYHLKNMGVLKRIRLTYLKLIGSEVLEATNWVKHEK